MNNIRGLTVSVIFKSGAINRDEKIGGSIASIKKLTKEGKTYSFLSRPFLRHHLFQHLIHKGWIEAPVEPKKDVIQFKFPDSNIVTYAEMDYFGYMMTNPFTITRKHPLGMTKAEALREWGGDVAFYANHNMVQRAVKSGYNVEPNPYSREEDENFYLLTYTFDLPRIGFEEVLINVNSQLNKKQKKEEKDEILKEAAQPLCEWLKAFRPQEPAKADELRRKIKRPWVKIDEQLEWYAIKEQDGGKENGEILGFVGFSFSLKDIDEEELEKKLKEELSKNGIKIAFVVTDAEYKRRLKDVLEAIESGYMLDASGECYSTTPLFSIAAALQVPVPLFHSSITIEKGKVKAGNLNSLINKNMVQKVWCEEGAVHLDGKFDTAKELMWDVEKMAELVCEWSEKRT